MTVSELEYQVALWKTTCDAHCVVLDCIEEDLKPHFPERPGADPSTLAMLAAERLAQLGAALTEAQRDTKRLDAVPGLVREMRLTFHLNGDVGLITRYRDKSQSTRRQTFLNVRDALDAAESSRVR